MKGIILAGGSGTRLYPNTKGISKQLIPVYDKPMIYYPLSILMIANIKDILIITTRKDQALFMRLLGDGRDLGINLQYAVQDAPNGLAEAFIIGKDFIKDDECAMILGDNIFYGAGLKKKLIKAKECAAAGYATVFGIEVKDPDRFGIMELDKNNNLLSIEEKPKYPKSNYAVTGLYFYPKGVSKLAEQIKPSDRNELEITSLNNLYLQQNKLKAEKFNEGFIWFDTGTFESQLDAANTIKTIESITAKVISCPEAIAYHNGWIDKQQLEKSAEIHQKNDYGKYLYKILERNKNE